MAQLPFTVLQPYGSPSTPGNLANIVLSNVRMSVKTITATSYTLLPSDSGSVLRFNSTSNVTVTFPNSLEEGWNALIVQVNTGSVSFSFGANTQNPQRISGLSAQNAYVSVIVDTNAGGAEASYTIGSGAGGAQQSGLPVNTVLPSIAGTPQVGQTLTGGNGTWTNTPSAYAYQWKRNGADISGATNATYAVTLSDLGTTITLQVTATNAAGSASATSAATATVANVGAPANTVLPTVSGTAQVGQTLTGTQGTWTGTGISYSYQWYANGVAISGATNLTYLVTTNEIGQTITFVVTANNGISGNITATSLPTATVTSAPGTAPANTILPVITGTATEGQTLSTDNGTWTNSPTSYAYQWKRDGANIASATNQTYLLVTADVGAVITVSVTAINASGSNTATSAATSTVAGASWSPLTLGSTLKGWWDVSATSTITQDGSGNVSVLGDRSGNGFDMTQATAGSQLVYSATAFNTSYPGLTSASGKSLSSPNVGIAAQYPNTVFVVGTPTASTSYLVNVAGTSANTLFGRVSTQWTNSTQVNQSGASATPVVIGGTKALSGGTYILSLSVNGTYSSGTSTTARGYTGVITIPGYAMVVSEVVVCDTALGTSDRQKLEGYLAWKWGLQSTLPADHPYKSAAP